MLSWIIISCITVSNELYFYWYQISFESRKQSNLIVDKHCWNDNFNGKLMLYHSHTFSLYKWLLMISYYSPSHNHQRHNVNFTSVHQQLHKNDLNITRSHWLLVSLNTTYESTEYVHHFAVVILVQRCSGYYRRNSFTSSSHCK